MRIKTDEAQGVPLAIGCVLVIWLLVAYRATVMQMAAVWWRSDTFAHGMLVAPIVIGLLWRDRARLAAVSCSPAPAGHALLALASLAWIAGQLAEAPVVSQFALVAMLACAVLAVFGTAATRAMAYPLAFLFFAVPAGEFLLPVMMRATADVTAWAVGASGVPVYREGLRFHIPSGQWSVVEACSGLRYLIASVVAGTLFAYLNFQSAWRRAAFIGCAIVTPVVANWARAYLIVMLGHVSGNRLAAGADHLIYGWVFFALVMAGLFALGTRFREPPQPAPARHRQPGKPARSGSLLVHALMAASIAGAAPLAAEHWRSGPVAPLPTLVLPEQIQGWRAGAMPGSWQPRWPGAQLTVSRAWVREGPEVGVVIALFPHGGGGARATSSENVLVASSDAQWAQHSLAGRSSPIGRLADSVVDGPGQRLRVWHGIWVNGVPETIQISGNRSIGALAIAASRLTGHNGQAALIAIFTPEDARAPARLAAFTEEAAPTLIARLREAAGR